MGKHRLLFKHDRQVIPHLEALMVHLHGLRVAGADEPTLFQGARSYCGAHGLGLSDDELRTIVHQILDRLPGTTPGQPPPTPNTSTETHATSANLHPGRAETQDLEDSEDLEGF